MTVSVVKKVDAARFYDYPTALQSSALPRGFFLAIASSSRSLSSCVIFFSSSKWRLQSSSISPISVLLKKPPRVKSKHFFCSRNKPQVVDFIVANWCICAPKREWRIEFHRWFVWPPVYANQSLTYKVLWLKVLQSTWFCLITVRYGS